jgi:hypothetical protein
VAARQAATESETDEPSAVGAELEPAVEAPIAADTHVVVEPTVAGDPLVGAAAFAAFDRRPVAVPSPRPTPAKESTATRSARPSRPSGAVTSASSR